jgi:hypothetical protein
MSKRILPVMFGLPQIVAQGPGTFLVTAQDRLARDQGITVIELWTAIGNRSIQKAGGND